MVLFPPPAGCSNTANGRSGSPASLRLLTRAIPSGCVPETLVVIRGRIHDHTSRALHVFTLREALGWPWGLYFLLNARTEPCQTCQSPPPPCFRRY
jgi:hypothetical protein